MKKKPARVKHHSRSTKHKLKSASRKKRTFKGGMGAGTLYAVVALLIIAFGATSMIGNIVPITSVSPKSGQPVNISPPTTDNARDNLQLFTFPGATYTPTPSPTTPPQPQQSWSGGNDGGSRSGGGNSNGNGDGGSAPVPPRSGGGNSGGGNSGGGNSGGIAR